MEVIKNYLENMFHNLPHTPEVLRAKDELWQMMEDKYTELIAEGKTENEAVGTVISEFGNLDELKELLGIQKYIDTPQVSLNQRMLTLEETKEYLADRAKQSFEIALGVFLCITSVTGPIFCDEIHAPDSIGAVCLFLFVAIAVGLFVHPSILMKKWDFLETTPCAIDFSTTKYIREQKDQYRTTYAMRLTISIILYVLSVVPFIVFDELHLSFLRIDLEGIGAVLLFLFVGIATFIIVLTCRINNTYSYLLQMNDAQTVGGNFVPNQQKNIKYTNTTIESIMSVYWLTVTCIYLSISFLSFDWWITWIIWPIAAIIHSVLKNAFSE